MTTYFIVYPIFQVHCTSVRVHQPSHSDVHDHNEHAGLRRADEEEHEEPHQPAAVRHGAQRHVHRGLTRPLLHLLLHLRQVCVVR